jgi:hypothetical protein
MKDLKHYFALIAGLSVGFAFFLVFNYNRETQMIITFAMAGYYILWGIVHHALRKNLHIRIIGEYFAVAVFASLLVVFLLFRA